MNKLLLTFFLFGFLFLNNCSKNEIKEIVKIQEDQIEGQMIKAYQEGMDAFEDRLYICLLYTSPSPRDAHESRMPSSA